MRATTPPLRAVRRGTSQIAENAGKGGGGGTAGSADQHQLPRCTTAGGREQRGWDQHSGGKRRPSEGPEEVCVCVSPVSRITVIVEWKCSRRGGPRWCERYAARPRGSYRAHDITTVVDSLQEREARLKGRGACASRSPLGVVYSPLIQRSHIGRNYNIF